MFALPMKSRGLSRRPMPKATAQRADGTPVIAAVARRAAPTFPLRRPATLARAAERAALAYRRERDLPGAMPGLLSGPKAELLPRLAEAEARCEAERHEKAPGYRPWQHLQILAALLAEAAMAGSAAGD